MFIKELKNNYLTFCRYGFNGQEKDNEIKGAGNSLNFKFRMHDPRLGRFFTTDPLSGEYASNSPYAFSQNNIISFRELEGLEANIAIYGTDSKTKQQYDPSTGKWQVVPKYPYYEATFKRAAETDARMTFNSQVVRAVTGKEFLNTLKRATKEEGSISRVAIYSHSDNQKIYPNLGNNGTTNTNAILRSGRRYSNSVKNSKSVNLSDLKKAIDNGEIKFADDAVIILAGCNAANEFDDNGNKLDITIAQDFAKVTGKKIIAAIEQSTESRVRSSSGGLNYYRKSQWVSVEYNSDTDNFTTTPIEGTDLIPPTVLSLKPSNERKGLRTNQYLQN